MKKRLLLLISAVVLIGSVVGGSTFAFFTANSPAQSSTFHAGTLTVALTDAGGAPLTAPFMTYNDLAPGDSVGPFLASVKNTGTLPLVYNFSFARVGATAPANDALAAALLLKVERETDGTWVTLGERTVDEWVTAGVSEWQPTLAAEGMAHFRYTPSLPLGTQNPAQAGSVLVTLLVSATQTSVVGGGTGVLAGTWKGQYTGDRTNSHHDPEDKIWPFVANVTQTGTSFSGTMTEPDDPFLGTTEISGTINGTDIAGTRMFGIFPVNFTGTLQPNGTVVIGTRDTDPAYPFTATKQ